MNGEFVWVSLSLWVSSLKLTTLLMRNSPSFHADEKGFWRENGYWMWRSLPSTLLTFHLNFLFGFACGQQSLIISLSQCAAALYKCKRRQIGVWWSFDLKSVICPTGSASSNWLNSCCEAFKKLPKTCKLMFPSSALLNACSQIKFFVIIYINNLH